MNKKQFIQELSKLNINLTATQLKQLDEYYCLLVSENKKYNLTSIIEEDQVYLKHFYDSITLSKIIALDKQEICDIGTGAGFPGMVLKIVFPNLKVTLVDATKKKCNFLELVISKLGLQDIEVLNERAEEYSKKIREKYDIVTSRAVAPLKHLLEYSVPLVKVNGHYIAMKSNIQEEIIGIESYEQKLKITEEQKIIFQLPIEDSTRTLIKYKKLEITNPKYPRRYNEIKNKSL